MSLFPSYPIPYDAPFERGVALVTGAAGTGIGAAVARAFLEAGCQRLVITDINRETLAKTQDSLEERYRRPGLTILAIDGDISSKAFAEELVEKAIEQFGRLDYCVNSAGIMGNNKSSTETSIDAFDKINGVNYRGCWLSSRAELKAMLKQEPLTSHDPARPAQRGSIVNIASQLGIVGRPECAAYSASKAAVIALTRADAIDYSKDGIRINCICPGIIDTPMTTFTEERRELLKPSIDIAPMKRMGLPQEIADCAIFLCSTKASFVQGAAMVVDGGYVIN
ncbi:oxidoreductase [Mytilinidion resinicola]|uniref:Oxidoreductase n=1 Tax=Mytilinidion resinicola TaxID=574789 RepID=A0A6A6Z2A5_9PEZI|nr:oxidoreductase [Mytilinidion resinicola]KAF2815266.1 oxidoreductase [Mytilinidion resinicola]